jgi:PTH1 family peptidyl-tRNA hydrolase
MESILQHLGDIPRLRIGIGAADGRAIIQHVLGKFSADERPILGEAVERAVQAVDCLRRDGIDKAMNQFN